MSPAHPSPPLSSSKFCHHRYWEVYSIFGAFNTFLQIEYVASLSGLQAQKTKFRALF